MEGFVCLKFYYYKFCGKKKPKSNLFTRENYGV